jgi:hypothetical protein
MLPRNFGLLYQTNIPYLLTLMDFIGRFRMLNWRREWDSKNAADLPSKLRKLVCKRPYCNCFPIVQKLSFSIVDGKTKTHFWVHGGTRTGESVPDSRTASIASFRVWHAILNFTAPLPFLPLLAICAEPFAPLCRRFWAALRPARAPTCPLRRCVSLWRTKSESDRLPPCNLTTDG